MSVEENKKVVRELVERTAAGDSSSIDELTTDDFVVHVLWGEGREGDRQVWKRTNDGGHVGFPDYSMAIDDMIAEGDKVMVLSTRRGTNTGQFLTLAPTGKSVKVSRFALYRLRDHKVAEMWVMDDQLGQLQELGVLPPQAEYIQAYKESHKG